MHDGSDESGSAPQEIKGSSNDAADLIMRRDVAPGAIAGDSLRDSERWYRHLFELHPHPMWVYDLETLRFLAVNDAAMSRYGYSREEFLAMTIAQIRPASALDALAADLATAHAGIRQSGQWQHITRDGRTLIVEISSHTLPFDDRPAALVQALDVTERVSVETQLREKAALLDTAHDAILVKDMDDRITYWNKGAERLFGWTSAEVLGRDAATLFSVDPTPYRAARDQLLARGQFEGELVKRTRDGRSCFVSVRWTLMRDADGAPTSALAITMDITERKRLETQVLRAQRLESLGTLAGGIAHDLNNVLAPILMSIDLLRDAETSEDKLATLAQIEASAERGADMVRQVLTFARGAEGPRRAVQLPVIARDVVKVAHDTFPKDIAIRLHAAPDIWTVSADPTQMHQVLMNLVLNARDAMRHGGTLVMQISNIMLDETDAGMPRDAKAGPYITLSVSDSGEGIPLAVQDRIFEPFFTTKDHGKGTGLGLSTVHSIVQSHRGFVTVSSEPARGTTFTVFLPASDDALPLAVADADSDRLPHGHGEQILVVDDEVAIRDVVQQTLERFNYQVLTAGNGAEAVALYVQHRAAIALVLTDMAMPVMDGPSMVSALRAIDPHVRIIASSGLQSRDVLAQTSGLPLVPFIPKPYTAETLLLAVHRALRQP